MVDEFNVEGGSGASRGGVNGEALDGTGGLVVVWAQGDFHADPERIRVSTKRLDEDRKDVHTS